METDNLLFKKTSDQLHIVSNWQMVFTTAKALSSKIYIYWSMWFSKQPYDIGNRISHITELRKQPESWDWNQSMWL